ncbi:MAG: C45 family peptidase [Desulfobacterales bacterium]|nr:C45 family peptidase [Desulfobacterales bacterium]
MLRRRWKIWTWAGAVLCFLGSQPASACTLWGASGTAVAGGGTLVAKNRDWSPDHRQELSVLRPAQGYRSLLLTAVGGAEPGVKAGVNEKGLVIVSATASQVPGTQRKAARQKKELMRFFLTTCASVDELLNQVELLRRPVFYLAGDRKEIALIEVAPEGRRSVRRQDSGTLHHTNHYCILDPADQKRKPGASSTQRYARMSELLKGPPAPFAAEDFIRFSADAVAGPDNSIWRTGSSPTRKRTLATWLVSVPTAGSPQLYLKTADPGEPEQVCRISVEAALGGGDRIPLNSELCR